MKNTETQNKKLEDDMQIIVDMSNTINEHFIKHLDELSDELVKTEIKQSFDNFKKKLMVEWVSLSDKRYSI